MEKSSENQEKTAAQRFDKLTTGKRIQNDVESGVKMYEKRRK